MFPLLTKFHFAQVYAKNREKAVFFNCLDRAGSFCFPYRVNRLASSINSLHFAM